MQKSSRCFMKTYFYFCAHPNKILIFVYKYYYVMLDINICWNEMCFDQKV